METKANTTLIGLFALGVIAIAGFFVYYVMSGSSTGPRPRYVLAFSGSVSGLAPGSPVTYNGMRRGDVLMVDSDPNDPTRSLALIAVDPALQLRKNFELSIETAALTGISSISLRGRTLYKDSDLSQLPADEQERLKIGQSLITPLPSDGRAKEQIHNQVPQMFSDLAQNQDIMASARTILARIDGVVEKLDRVIAVGEGPITRSLANIDKVTKALGDNSTDIEIVVKNLAGFSTTLNSDDTKRLITDAADTATRLKQVADNVDKLLAGFNSSDNQNMFAELTKAAQSFRKLADSLDGRTAELTSSFNGFTTRTTRDIQGLADEGKRTLGEIDRTLRSLERNPQRVIWGGSGVPEYNRR
jgi:phospholipid/cholesterol/gamma-HCH transport system substrate-binding protein